MMVIVFAVIAFLIGLYVGKEWMEIRFQKRMVALEHDCKYWREIASRQSGVK